MPQTQHPGYGISSGSDAPILWYASLPDQVKRLYALKGQLSGQPALMVILADVLCQAFTIWALEELFRKKNVPELWQELSSRNNIRRYQNICDGRVDKIYTALSGDKITERSLLWEKLREHNDRRQRLVHPDRTGAIAPMPTPQEAEESFKAVESYMQHVHGILSSI